MTRKISRERAEEILNTRKFHVPDDASVISDFDNMPDDEWDMVFETMNKANKAMDQNFWTKARLKRLKELSDGGWEISSGSPSFQEDSKILMKSADQALIFKIQSIGNATLAGDKAKVARKYILIIGGVIAISTFVVKWELVPFLGAFVFLFLVDQHYQRQAKRKLLEIGELPEHGD